MEKAGEDAKKQSRFKVSRYADRDAENDCFDEEVNRFRGHPYRYLLLNYKPSTYDISKPPVYKAMPIDQTPCILVDTKRDFEKLVEHLMNEKEIGVANKYNTHTYEAQLCYLLISTKKANYLIDCLNLRNSLRLLNDVFTSLHIVKVVESMHNVRALQANDLWFVNAFDLKVAFQTLDCRESYGGYVRKRHDATYNHNRNLGNWKISPLSKPYRKDAVMNIHYLIELYTVLKQELIDRRLIKLVLKNCNFQCGRLYSSDITVDQLFPDGLDSLPASQVAFLHRLDEWRHRLAKQHNCTVNKILHDDNMLQLATSMSKIVAEVVATGQSVYVEKHLDEIQSMMEECRQVIGPEKQTSSRPERKALNTDRESECGTESAKRKRPVGFIKPFESTQFEGFNNDGEPQGGQFGNLGTVERHGSAFGRDLEKHFRNLQNRPSSSDFQGRLSEFINSRWDGEPTSKKPQILPHLASQAQGSGSRWPLPSQSSATSSTPSSYKLVSSKGDVILLGRLNIPPSFLGSSKTESLHKGNCGNDNRGRGNSSDNCRSNDSSAWGAMNRASQQNGGDGGQSNDSSDCGAINRASQQKGGDGGQRNDSSAAWGAMNRTSQPNDPTNTVGTLLSLSATLMNLNILYMAGRNSMNVSASGTNRSSTASYKQNNENLPSNNSNQGGSQRGTTHSMAVSSMGRYPDGNLSQSFNIASYPNQSGIPDVVFHLNQSQSANVFVCDPSQSSNRNMDPRYDSFRN